MGASSADRNEQVATAERAVLGAALHSRAAYERCRDIVTGTDFYAPAHQVIWDAIATVNAGATDDVQADVTLVLGKLSTAGTLVMAGGAPYLATLYGQVVTPANASHYAALVRDASRDRALVALGTRLVQGGGLGLSAADRADLVTQTESGLAAVTTAGADATAYQPVGSALEELWGVLDGTGPAGVELGLPELDAHMGGVAPGEVCLIAARTGVGKTVVLLQAALHIARQGRPVLLFSLEMRRVEVVARLLCAMAQVSSSHMNLRSPRMTDDDWTRLADVVGELESLPLHVVDAERLTPSQIEAITNAFVRQHGVPAIIGIDHVGLVRPDRPGRSRTEEVGLTSDVLRQMAKRLRVPVVALVQLNRDAAKRGTDSAPQLVDLKDAGSLEENANIVILLHRPDQAEPETKRTGEIDLIVAKDRAGGYKKVTMLAQLHYYRLMPMTEGGIAGAAERAATAWGINAA
ncbi:MAG: replicative DNA helicase [Cellulomonas sp.]